MSVSQNVRYVDLDDWRFEIRRAAPVVVHFAIRLRKSSRLNQFVAHAYSRRRRKMYEAGARNLVHLTFVSFWFIASRSGRRLYCLIMKNKPLREMPCYFHLRIERIMNNRWTLFLYGACQINKFYFSETFGTYCTFLQLRKYFQASVTPIPILNNRFSILNV